ncbi:MAG: Penicillin-binding protein, 1A family [Microgenomates group bacterium GW2011_GWC1_41_8]|uniref:Penicillin-binding protein, 1A family n=3 Tax=Candidatus Roizmaniibacteriota TaxID=1752723 RepID=A0A0G1A986_9BACT|nr:MAG: Penicillin-binding protein, 1A family [Candidatus Levybacteria bacterium GW2011_GWA2_40_16]KKR72458.1 MAG: Penicillin-binding protein, 1A family [Candidatus Roizmanbacteria bacterium GW2011_GWB1_40_7]KKR94793.1 MAG: Penicillin-binding protein, 1A family [Candidatus Roizmanbacteria bacterium GW2011_GWA1_41_13]KKS21888.1 MAG: Penicillin-binding protein, 1A family [Candidatus Roizmanbacteria bacterium GW2011_GWC2_41_7]KKS23399.1 MAG: Penicillin-binding protein, 1A family [Microgenomates gr
MGYLVRNLIIFVLQFFKFVGDATIWLIETQYLAIIFIVKLILWILKVPIIVTRIATKFIAQLTKNVWNRVRKIQIPRLLKLPVATVSRKESIERSIGYGSQKKSKRSFKTTWAAIKNFMLGFSVASVILGIVSGYTILSKDLPHPQLLTKRDIPLTTKIYDRNGELLYEIYADQNRTSVTLEELPDYFVNATIAVEDQGFYYHQGFSPRGIVRAAYSTIINDDLQGGSTITQQLVRSALLNQEITLSRKIRELILSIWTEQLYTKEEILTMYFNQVPYGGTAWGAEAAAQTYFGKTIRDVTLGEAALLAGLPAAPTYFSPFGAQPELAKLRKQEVLRRMEEEGFITRAEREQAEAEELALARPQIGIKAPHFVMYVRQVLSERYGPRMVEQGGLIVHTSLDLSLQDEIQKIVSEEVSKLRALSVGNGAVVVTDPQTGEILAMVGSTDYFDLEKEGNVNVTLSPQQPGSTIKVVTYTAALQDGFTAATLLQDSPITYTAAGSPPYSPVNYDGKFHGMVPLRYALGNSYNIPAVRTLAKIGIPTMIDQGNKMGIDSWDGTDGYGLSITLGGGEVTMLDMAEVYGTLSNKGKHHDLKPILKITDHLGTVIEDNSQIESAPVVSEEAAYIISDILADNGARTAAFGPSSDLNIPNNWVAVKTGTSNDKRDNWTIGYTQDFVVVSWVGNNDNSPMNQTLTSGITGATPIWRKITDKMLEKFPSQKPNAPINIVKLPCREREEYFIKGTEPAGGCASITKPTGEAGKKDTDQQSEHN